MDTTQNFPERNMRLYNLLKFLGLGVTLFIINGVAWGAGIPLIMEGKTNPVAVPKAMVKSGEARFTVLTPSLIRMEWAPGGMVEDRPSLAFINRRLPLVDFTSSSLSGWLMIETSDLILKYQEGSGSFTADNLSIELKSPATRAMWHPGLEDSGNLGGTVRTLDQVSGSTTIGKGVISRDGWVLIDDSQTLLIGKDQWPTARTNKGIDWYFFGYGHNYKKALEDFAKVSGEVPLPPRWSFGAWWSRYWDYSEAELKILVEDFREHDVPLDVLVVDMGWHLPGWTGFTWNPDYFPNPKEFLKWCHKEKLHTTLNLHPHEGVGKQEAGFSQIAKALELKSDSIANIPFDITNKNFMQAYFKYLLHPLEMQGVDFWWIDWQQGQSSKIPGLDPLFWLNHLHWKDFEDNPYRKDYRPLIMSRWGGLGSQRYQIGFSGDTHSIWETLAFLPDFTASAGNVCYPYWSHDIGGHYYGSVEGELYARWIQFGALNPFLRTHATKNPQAERRIWAFEDEVFQSARASFQLRYSLVPYIYTSAKQCYDKALPLVRPLYLEWPEIPAAYEFKGEYLFGDQMLVAPVVTPADPASGLAYTLVWIPPGVWYGWFDGKQYQGPKVVAINSTIDDLPLFIKEGGIIPQVEETNSIADKVFDSYVINIFPGESGAYKLYEDDGVSRRYQSGEFAYTKITCKREGKNLNLDISPPNGSFRGMPQKRAFEIIIRDTWPVTSILVNGVLAPRVSADKKSTTLAWWFDTRLFAVHLQIPKFYTSEPLNISVQLSTANESPLRAGLRGKFEQLEKMKTILGDKTPEDIVSLIERKNELLSKVVKEENLRQAAEVIDRRWMELALQAGQAEVGADAGKKAFLQMTGISSHLKLTQLNVGELMVEANITTDKVLDNLSAKVTFKTPLKWTANKEAMLDYNSISPENPLSLRVMFQTDSIPMLTEFTANFSVKLGDYQVDFSKSQTLYPSINAWMLIGPFDNPADAGLDIAFPPEQNLDLAAEYFKADGSKLAWGKGFRGLESPLDAEFYVDLNKYFGGEFSNSAGYAFTYLYSPNDTLVYLTLGSDDGVAVWVNGECIHRNAVTRAYAPKQDKVAMNLKAGNNTLLLKIIQGTGGWGFSANVEEENGAPALYIKSKLEP